MSVATAEQLFHEFRSNANADVTLSLLRSRDASLDLALMAAHLGDGQVVDSQTLAAVIDTDLPALLRSYPTDDDRGASTLSDAEAVLTRWRKKRWVHRSADPRDPRVERYQLSSGAHAAVRQMRNLQRRPSIATESALAIVMSELHHIAEVSLLRWCAGTDVVGARRLSSRSRWTSARMSGWE